MERAFADDPDLVITNVGMPKLDGFELTRRLRSDARTRSMPIVILTAQSTEAYRAQGLAAGTDLDLTKPFDRDELLAHVKEILWRGR